MNNVVNLQDYKNKKENKKPDTEMTLDERLARISNMINQINATIKELDNHVNRGKK